MENTESPTPIGRLSVTIWPFCLVHSLSFIDADVDAGYAANGIRDFVLRRAEYGHEFLGLSRDDPIPVVVGHHQHPIMDICLHR